jgi:F-type H+-transporting ATPase subunit delta
MSEVKVASRYAKSLIDLAQEQNILESVKNDIELFIDTCQANPTLRAVLKNPIIGPDKKTHILNAVFAGRFDFLVLSFFKIVITKGRSGILYATAKEFINEYHVRKNMVKAIVTSAVALNEDNKRKIESTVTRVTKGEVILIEKVDPKLIAGFVLKVGDKQIDTSILSQLQKLRKEFTQKVIA